MHGHVPWCRYVIDTNEELSAFDAALLERQAAFALDCLAHLAVAYGPAAPDAAAGEGAAATAAAAAGEAGRDGHAAAAAAAAAGAGVFLVGHSMGGAVARLVLRRAASDARLGPGGASLLLAVASPLAAPPLMLQPRAARLYRELQSPLATGQHSSSGSSVLAPLIITVTGGARDLQVAESLASLVGAAGAADAAGSGDGAGAPAPRVFEAEALDVPGVWSEAGHNEIASCNQLLRRLAGLLLDLVARRTQSEAAGAAAVAPPRARARSDAATVLSYLRGRTAHALAATPAAVAAAAAAGGALKAAAAARDASGAVRAAEAPFHAPLAPAPPACGGGTSLAELLAALPPPPPRPARARRLRRPGGAPGEGPLFVDGAEFEGGGLFSWDVPPRLAAGDGAGGLLLVVSAAQPCKGFRLWLELAPAPASSAAAAGGGSVGRSLLQDAAGGSGNNSNRSSDSGGALAVEIGHLASPLPCVDAAAALRVRDDE